MDEQRPTSGRQELAGWQSALGAPWVQLGLSEDVLGQLRGARP
jgi:hypothetical protein